MTPVAVLTTGEGKALRVGPLAAEHAVGLLANGAGSIGVAVAADGSFLAFTCGVRANPDAWYSGDWYRGTLAGDRPAEATGPDGERLRIARAPGGGIVVVLTSAAEDTLTAPVAVAVDGDGLYRRDDADGVLGAVALPGNAVCAVKRTSDGRFLPAGTVPY